MEFSDIVALSAFFLGLAYIAYWYLKKHLIGTRSGESICSYCGGKLTLQKETLLRKIIKRTYIQVGIFFPKKHRVKETWVCNSCNSKTERTVSFG